jgi:predicted DNA-binding transcriptional regulator YafY
MPKNKSAVLRYHVIDSCLTNKLKPYPTKEFLKEKIDERLDIDISLHMITKDLDEMRIEYGAPIEFSRLNKGYYYSQEGYSICNLPLTHAEIEALDYSTALLNCLKGSKLLDRCNQAIDKLIEGYRITKALGIDHDIIQIEEPVKVSGSEWIESILHAIVNKESLLIEYKSFTGTEKSHVFSPYLLKEYRNRWYTIGHSNLSSDLLLLGLDRIKSIQKSEVKFKATDGFSPKEFFKYSFGISQFHDTAPEKVILSFTPFQAAYILSQPLHHTQKTILQNEKEIQVELEVYISVELIMTILGYGTEVKVLSPLSLKNRIKETAAIVASY